MAVMCRFTHKVLCHVLWVHQVYLRPFLLLCSLSELGWPIQLILQITFASKYQFCWRSFFSLWPYAVWSSGTNQPLCLTGLCTLFKLSSDQFRPPREVLTSSEKSFKNRQWWESRFSLPSDSSQTPIPMDIEDERKKTEEMMKKEMILLSSPLNSICIISIPLFLPTLKFSSLSRCISLWAKLKMKKIQFVDK